MARDSARDISVNLHWPQYERDEKLGIDREKNIPPASLYMGLGWDVDRSTKRKHYRHYYEDELENVKEIFGNGAPFDRFDLTRG